MDRMLQLFRSGMDTNEIAKKLFVPEAEVSRRIWVARSRELGLPARYLGEERGFKQKIVKTIAT